MSVLGSILALLGVAASVRPKPPARDKVEDGLIAAKLRIGALEADQDLLDKTVSALEDERDQLLTDLAALRVENGRLRAERSTLREVANLQMAQFQAQQPAAGFGQLNAQQAQQLAGLGQMNAQQALGYQAFENEMRRFCTCVPARHDALLGCPLFLEGVVQ